MIDRDLAERLRRAGLTWRPANGDRFLVPDRDLDDQVFVVSDMTIDVVDLPRLGGLVRFNGTTEWALDSIAADEVVWLPREDQLREALVARVPDDRPVALERVPHGWVVVVGDQRHVEVDAERAWARALLAELG